jgi:hypothetical protein
MLHNELNDIQLYIYVCEGRAAERVTCSSSQRAQPFAVMMDEKTQKRKKTKRE